MFWLTVHAMLLIAFAYVLGCVSGCLARQIFASDRPTPTAAAGAGASGGTAVRPAPDVSTRAAAAPSEPTAKPAASAPKTGETKAAPAASKAKPAKAKAEPAAKDEAKADGGPAIPDEQPGTPSTPDAPPPPPVTSAKTAPPIAPEDASRAAAADAVGTRPSGLAAPRSGGADNLKRVKGIGPQNEARLNALGCYHFDQIAEWTPENCKWVGAFLAFPGRIEREDWVGQAAKLAAGEATEFAARVDKGGVAYADADREAEARAVAERAGKKAKPKGKAPAKAKPKTNGPSSD